MKNILLNIAIILLFIPHSFSQCGPTEVIPSPQVIGHCEGYPDTISFTADGICNRDFEYQVLNSANVVVQPWSNNDQYIHTGDVSDTYTVNSRCRACPTVIVSDTFLIESIGEPTIQGNDFVCYGSSVNLTTQGAPAGDISWWDSETGGTQLSTNEIYNASNLTESDTVYTRIQGNINVGLTQGSILITEAGLEGFLNEPTADYLEITNPYGVPVNTTGWVVAVSDSYSDINDVNTTLWNLPNSFAPCSILSKTDVRFTSSYWGENIFWNPYNPGWAMILDDSGEIVDFVAWGWSAADLAGLNTVINGYNITLGSEWIGPGCNDNCAEVNNVQYSLSRVVNSDNNDLNDFICQPTSLNVINPGLNCGWVASDFTCAYPAAVTIDSLPSASTPDTTFVDCYSAVPAPNTNVITNLSDDYTIPPNVQFISETSNNSICPEILTRTYQLADSCNNTVDIEHIIVIHDTVAPILDPAPADVTVACYADIPPMQSLNWTDNCSGNGVVQGVETSNGETCPEILTRTWSVSDTCGNTATETQTIIINDTISPNMDLAPADTSLQCRSELEAMVALNWTDNCAGNGVLNGVETVDGNTCPETITRKWEISDGCDNTTEQTQIIVINDDTPPTASNLPTIQLAELPEPDPSLITDATDNCGTPVVEWLKDSTDYGFCPEKVVRTYSITDDCGNVSYVKQNFTIGDNAPKADFNAEPTLLDNFSDGVVEFYNTTTGAVSYEWDFGDGSPFSYITNPNHEYDISKSTSYEVWLKAFSKFDCRDSANITINVFQELVYFIPNAFTPNNDENNPVFTPIFVAGFDPGDYHFTIYNRWGETMFESFNPDIGWDGSYNNKIAQEGVYVYKISFGMENTDERKVITGHFSLLK
ncbi:hypothetical protein CW751_06165 [Brumimicrobium salinarum]|uniref:PKD domain-containing protein n=1 Tax=Brumimicrobium salinarum TaxID=2058658 RepID=A0A2I0R3K7_9FLAO|nr:gliding motility-associated C-terminal domain-containing protein [Brumimicrobium salinarum]PKR81166.1 hypothetical protein CW751_06165 [Brumimicrobium salinarum]